MLEILQDWLTAFYENAIQSISQIWLDE